jgi:hypothetical protein
VPDAHPHGAIADCSTRSEARFPRAFNDPANLVVGPLVLVGGSYTPAQTVRQFGGNKFPALVSARHTVTIQLPSSARDVARLGWGSRRGGLIRRVARHTVNFIACDPDERSGSSVDGAPVTFWSGGVSTAAPGCVPLRIYVDDEPEPRRVRLPLGRNCPFRLSTTTADVPRRCPARGRTALPLGPQAEALAEQAVLRREDPKLLPEARAVPAAEAGVRGRSARYYCGERIAERTLVVFVHRAAFDPGGSECCSASLAQGVFLVSRFEDGHRVWLTLHG